MAAMPPSQVRALYPDRTAFVDRHGRGPQSPSALRSLLSETRQRGYATEDGEVTPGFASVAGEVVFGPQRHPAWRHRHHLRDPERVNLEALVDAVSGTARAVSRRLGGVAT